MSDQCDHEEARIEHQDMHGSEVEAWVACDGCYGYWTVHYDLDRLDADIEKTHDDYRDVDVE